MELDITDEDITAVSLFLADEIGYPYIMDKKSYSHKPLTFSPFISYRKPISLWREETTILGLFIEVLFLHYHKEKTLNGFDWQTTLDFICSQVAMADYSDGSDLRAICFALTEQFPNFIKSVEKRMIGYVGI